jgi:hypothetical protein
LFELSDRRIPMPVKNALNSVNFFVKDFNKRYGEAFKYMKGVSHFSIGFATELLQFESGQHNDPSWVQMNIDRELGAAETYIEKVSVDELSKEGKSNS